MIANKERGEFITEDGKLEITLKEYNKRTDEFLGKNFWIWLGGTAIVLFAIAVL